MRGPDGERQTIVRPEQSTFKRARIEAVPGTHSNTQENNMKRAAKIMAPLPIILMVVSFLCPTELSLYLGGLRLPPHRVAMLLLLPLAVWRIVMRPDVSLKNYDVVFILFNLWTIAVFTHNEDGQAGFVYGGSLALESLGGYLIARAWVRDVDTFQASLRVIATAIVVAALFALPETLLGKTFTHDFLAKMTGYVHPTATETRLGLTRAYGTFDHPIHYGTFCAGLLALFWFAERRVAGKRKKAALLVGATFLGISSAPMLCLALQAGMLVWEKISRGVTSRVSLTLAALTVLYIAASMVSNRTPITLIATGMTLDPWTGFYRLQIWEHGLNNVWANPLFGIGLDEWERPKWMVSSTVDAFWLVIAMRSGIPAFLLLATAIVLIGRAVVKNQRKLADPIARKLVMGWFMSLIALSLIGCTVHYWNVLYSYFFFFLGLGGWLADPKKTALKSYVRHMQQRHAVRTPHVAGPKQHATPPPIPRSPQQAPGSTWPQPGFGPYYGPAPAFRR